MCLAVPMRIVGLSGYTACCEVGSGKKLVC